jgi:RNA polymerase sigma-70 factor (sigma-E family)
LRTGSVDAVNVLQSGPLCRFADWPNYQIPEAADGRNRAAVVQRFGLVWCSGGMEGGCVDDGEESEFSEFVHGRWQWLAKFAYGLTGDPGLAEDLAQTALVNAYAAWPRVRRADDPDAYLRRIVVNAYKAGFRKRRVREQLTGSPHESAERAAVGAGEHDDRAAIIAALRKLPLRQREIVVMRYWLDLSETQVAAALQCSPGNVRSQASRALAKLRSSAELAEWGRNECR